MKTNMKQSITALLLLGMVSLGAKAQLTLEQCRELARENYPTIKQLSLVEQSRDFTIENAKKANMPQVTLNARAQYQSDATKFVGEVQGIDFKGLSRDQYDFSLSVTQSVYDGGAVASQKRVAQRQGDVDYEQVNVTLYAIYERVEEIFFGILSLDEQLHESALHHNDLELSLGTVTAMLNNGTAMQSDVDAVKVEMVQVEQQQTSQQASREAYLTMLSTFIGQQVSSGEQLEKPALEDLLLVENRRPELALYDAQKQLVEEQWKALDISLKPKLGLFANGGYSNPGLNLFKTGFQAYYQVGATLTWNFGNLYTRRGDRGKLQTQRETIESNRETFMLNTTLQSQMEGGSIANLRKQLEQDEEIISLRESIRQASEKKVENGTETVNEMLRDINAVSEARLDKSQHELQLLQEIQKLRTINNN